MKFNQGILLLFILSSSVSGQPVGVASNKNQLSTWAYAVLNIPRITCPKAKPVLIAVIDDGFRLGHNSLKAFLYHNKAEIPDNLIDDDQNGYIDDCHGWDVSDNDNNAGIISAQAPEYYHGTFIASVITSLAQNCFGETACEKVKILPIKVLSDNATTTAIIDGYQGVKYAIAAQADIICCAWSGGSPTGAEKDMVNMALGKGIVIVASSGNVFKEGVDFPSSIPGVIAISAIDTMYRKIENSNYGMKVDLALPGIDVKAAYAIADNAWFYGGGTSAAAALATGCFSVLKILVPGAGGQQISEALKCTAIPIDSVNLSYCGKLGSGIPNLAKAIEYLQTPKMQPAFFDSFRPEGIVYLSKGLMPDNCWKICPYGAYRSIHFMPGALLRKDKNKKIRFYTADSLCYEGTLSQIGQGIDIPGSCVKMQLASGKKKIFDGGVKINYYAETIDSSLLYCSETTYLNASEGQIEDNSLLNKYANNCSCKWQITAPENTQISINFTQFDTEAKVDFVWLFEGTNTVAENIIAKFSGDKIPPSLISATNKVLLWFVTDSRNTRQGWKLTYSVK